MSHSSFPPLALAIVDGHAIFLDCLEDRYFAVSPAENDALIGLLDGEDLTPRAQRAIAAVIGMEADGPTLRAMMAGDLPSPASDQAAIGSRSSLRRRLGAIRHYAVARLMLKARGFHAALAALARLPVATNKSAARGYSEVEQIASAHEWLARHVTAHDACLVRSLAMALHLRKSHHRAALVIGVRADPFAAHCWVQVGDRLLVEDSEIARAFTPILIVQ